ncbi:hypothetical protein N9Y92_00100 [Chlamydiales bacterium]|nr:hypothetical protein [Chlamydiales bacterium]
MSTNISGMGVPPVSVGPNTAVSDKESISSPAVLAPIGFQAKEVSPEERNLYKQQLESELEGISTSLSEINESSTVSPEINTLTNKIIENESVQDTLTGLVKDLESEINDIETKIKRTTDPKKLSNLKNQLKDNKANLADFKESIDHLKKEEGELGVQLKSAQSITKNGFNPLEAKLVSKKNNLKMELFNIDKKTFQVTVTSEHESQLENIAQVIRDQSDQLDGDDKKFFDNVSQRLLDTVGMPNENKTLLLTRTEFSIVKDLFTVDIEKTSTSPDTSQTAQPTIAPKKPLGESGAIGKMTSFHEITTHGFNLKMDLKNISKLNPEQAALLLKNCDDFSRLLLDQSVSIGPLRSNNNTQEMTDRMELAVEIRHACSSVPLDGKSLGMSDFSSTKAVSMTLIGCEMNTGTYCQDIDAAAVHQNQVQLTRVQKQSGEKEVLRTQLRFQLNPIKEKHLQRSLPAFDDAQFVEILSSQMGAKVTVQHDVKVPYEISESTSRDGKPVKVTESKAEFGNFTSIKIEGIGEILIGSEDMESGQGRYIAHHTVLVRVEDSKLDESQLNTSDQLNKMNQLLATVGLSEVLTKSSTDGVKKARVMAVIEAYLPSLVMSIKLSENYINFDADALIRDVCELLPENNEAGVGKTGMKEIFAKELEGEPKFEVDSFGNRHILLSSVVDNMRKEGALGFFAGVHSDPRVVTSVLTSGMLSSDARSSAGFKYPSTCQEDAITMGNGAVFARLATKGTIEKMQSGDLHLNECPYINTYQVVVDLDIAALPSNRMHHNSFGLMNPQAEVGEGNDKVSGVQVLESQDPIEFTKQQNRNPTGDNEVMVRVGAISSGHIKRVVYQNPQKALVQYLQDKKAPKNLTDKIHQQIQKGGGIDGELKGAIEKFLSNEGLLEEKVNNWGGKTVEIKGFQSKFAFANDLGSLLVDPKKALITSMQEGNLIDGENKFNGILIDDFIVEAEVYTEDLFGDASGTSIHAPSDTGASPITQIHETYYIENPALAETGRGSLAINIQVNSHEKTLSWNDTDLNHPKHVKYKEYTIDPESKKVTIVDENDEVHTLSLLTKEVFNTCIKGNAPPEAMKSDAALREWYSDLCLHH